MATSSSGSRGGGELFLLLLGRALAARGHEVGLWAASHPRMDELCSAFSEWGNVSRSAYENLYENPARCFSVFFHGNSIRRTAREWSGIAPDILHINKQNLEDGLDMLRAGMLAGIPRLATVHITQSATWLGARMAGPRDWLARRELRRFDGPLTVVSKSRERALREFLGEEKHIDVIENGVDRVDVTGDRDAVRRQIDAGQNALVFLCAARLEAQKRPLLFIEWAVRLHREFPGSRFVWLGEGRLEGEWNRAVEAAGGRDFIRQIGWQGDVGPWLAAADIFLHTAFYEGLPLALLEAMSAGLPLAMPADLLQDFPFLEEAGSRALVLGPGLIDELRDRVALRSLGDAMFRLWQCRFSLDRMASDYEALYASMR